MKTIREALSSQKKTFEGNSGSNGDGTIKIVDPETFINRLDGFNTAISIYVACSKKRPIARPQIAERASSALYDSRFSGYSLLDKNCHNFTRYCLTGNLESGVVDFTFSSLESLLDEKFNADEWRVWDFKNEHGRRRIQPTYSKESNEKKCIYCNSTLEPGAKFCTNCGNGV